MGASSLLRRASSRLDLFKRHLVFWHINFHGIGYLGFDLGMRIFLGSVEWVCYSIILYMAFRYSHGISVRNGTLLTQ